MFLLRVIELLAILGVILFVLTQIVEPIVNNRPLFPMFSKKLAGLHSQVEQLNEEERAMELQELVVKKEAALKARQEALQPTSSEAAPAATDEPKQ